MSDNSARSGDDDDDDDGTRGLIKSPQNFVGGLALLIFSGVCWWAVSDLRGIRGASFGPGTMPRIYVAFLMFFALLVTVSAFTTRGPKLETMPWRAPFFIMAGVIFFGLTIRGFDLGVFKVPGLGLPISGFVTTLLAGAAMDDFRLGEGVLFAAAITAFCVLLFAIVLGQPIPVYPPFLR